jgi:hypothetical protein
MDHQREDNDSVILLRLNTANPRLDQFWKYT